MREDGIVHWDYSYAFAHRTGVYVVIVSTNRISGLSRSVPSAWVLTYDRAWLLGPPRLACVSWVVIRRRN